MGIYLDDLLGVLTKSQLIHLAKDCRIKLRGDENKDDLVLTIYDSDKVSIKKMREIINPAKLDIPDLLELMFNTAQLRKLAKAYDIELIIKRRFRGEVPATRREDITEILEYNLSKQKMLEFLKGKIFVAKKKTEKQETKQVSEIEYEKVLRAVKNTPFILPKGKRKYEDDYEIQLYQSLRGRFQRSNVRYEKSRIGSRFDVIVNNRFAIELKVAKGYCPTLRTLSHQIDKYSKEVEKLIVLIIDDGAKRDILREHLDLLKNREVDIVVKDTRKFM